MGADPVNRHSGDRAAVVKGSLYHTLYVHLWAGLLDHVLAPVAALARPEVDQQINFTRDMLAELCNAVVDSATGLRRIPARFRLVGESDR